MAKLLVVGGNGFIGAEICKVALGRGDEVVSVTRSGAPKEDAPWTEEVTWVAADVFALEGWRAHLEGCDAVIHSLGIRKERPEQGVTFKRLNGDSVIIAAQEAERASVGAFVFISAATTPPTFSPAYLEAKRRAERAILKRAGRTVILRPALVYGAARPLTVLVGKALEVAQRSPGMSRENRPMSTHTLARAAVQATGEAEGILGVSAIESLSKELRTYAR